MKTAIYWAPNTPHEHTTLHEILANPTTRNYCIIDLSTLEPTSNLVILGQPDANALNNIITSLEKPEASGSGIFMSHGLKLEGYTTLEAMKILARDTKRDVIFPIGGNGIHYTFEMDQQKIAFVCDPSNPGAHFLKVDPTGKIKDLGTIFSIKHNNYINRLLHQLGHNIGAEEAALSAAQAKPQRGAVQRRGI